MENFPITIEIVLTFNKFWSLQQFLFWIWGFGILNYINTVILFYFCWVVFHDIDAPVYLNIHLLKDTQVVSSLGALQRKLP
jgi:hypothetical protein